MQWYDNILEKWDGIKFSETGITANSFSPEETVTFTCKVDANGTEPEHLGVFAAVEFGGESGSMNEPQLIRLDYDGKDGNMCVFKGIYKLEKAGKFKTAFLITPYHLFLKNPFELNKVKWA